MATRLGYLLPTREKIMAGEPAATPLLDLAARAERLGFDAIWIGDSLFARPRHAPLTLMTAIAARLKRVEVGTAVQGAPRTGDTAETALAIAVATAAFVLGAVVFLGLRRWLAREE